MADAKQKAKGPEKKMELQFETDYKGHKLEVYSKEPIPEGAKMDDLLLQKGVAFKEGEHWLSPFEREEMREEAYNFEKEYQGTAYLFSTTVGEMEKLSAKELLAKTMDVKVYGEGGEVVSISERRKLVASTGPVSKEAEAAAKGAGLLAAMEPEKAKAEKAPETKVAKAPKKKPATGKKKEGLLAEARGTFEPTVMPGQFKEEEEKKKKAAEAAKGAGIVAAIEKETAAKPAPKAKKGKGKPKYSKEADALLASLGAPPVTKKKEESASDIEEVIEKAKKAKKAETGKGGLGEIAGGESKAAELSEAQAGKAATGKVKAGGKKEVEVKAKEKGAEKAAGEELEWPSYIAPMETTVHVPYTFESGGETHSIMIEWGADTAFEGRVKSFNKALKEGRIGAKPTDMTVMGVLQMAKMKTAYIDGKEVSKADLEALEAAVRAGQIKIVPYTGTVPTSTLDTINPYQ